MFSVFISHYAELAHFVPPNYVNNLDQFIVY